MKLDSQLKKDVEAELAWDPAVQSTTIGVGVRNGIVTLTGHIETYAEKYAAERAVRRVAGVKAIAVELDVLLSPEHRRSDSEIATAVEQVLRTQVNVADKVSAMVEKGWVTLSGEVDWDYQRRNAEKAVRVLQGVTGITNEIRLHSLTAPDAVQLQKGIADALKRQAERDAEHITIEVRGSTVTLRGHVSSWQERIAAQNVAWSAPGVTTVINALNLE